MRDAGYRTQEEIDAAKPPDPIARLGARLLADGTAGEDELAAIEANIKAIVADALEFATNSPYPDPATATDHIFSTP